jgi:hypothetical protein
MSASCCSCTVSSTSMRCWPGERVSAGKLLCASSKHTTHGDTRRATCRGDGAAQQVSTLLSTSSLVRYTHVIRACFIGLNAAAAPPATLEAADSAQFLPGTLSGWCMHVVALQRLHLTRMMARSSRWPWPWQLFSRSPASRCDQHKSVSAHESEPASCAPCATPLGEADGRGLSLFSPYGPTHGVSAVHAQTPAVALQHPPAGMYSRLAPMSRASACTSSVLPHPEGPYSSSDLWQ